MLHVQRKSIQDIGYVFIISVLIYFIWRPDHMAAILQTTSLNQFAGMNIVLFLLIFPDGAICKSQWYI